jgi:hypothetical protein
MNDLDAVRIAVHEKNISRYRWLLRTKLTDVERDYVERRLAEEQRALALLTQTQQPQMRQQQIRHQRERAGKRSRAAPSTLIAAASLAGRNRGSSHSTE